MSRPERPAVAGAGVYEENGRRASRTGAPRSATMRDGSKLTRYE